MTLDIVSSNRIKLSIYGEKDNIKSNSEFTELTDPVSEAIRKNVKDPIDREEDLRFWKSCAGIKPIEGEMTYEKFLELKKQVVGFPPPSAPGKVRKAYREYMDKLPKNIKDNMQGILTFAYGLFINEKNINTSSWGEVLGIMKQHVGEVGDANITDFNFLNRMLDDFASFNEDTKEDESVRQIII